MTLEQFRSSVTNDSGPDATLTPAMQALWFDARGQWNRAHECAQSDPSAAGSWVHAYLHRKEGDLGNAGYWYARAGQKPPGTKVTLEAEWEAIARELLPQMHP